MEQSSLLIPEVKSRKKRRDVHAGDRRFFWTLRAVALLILAVLIAIAVQLFLVSLPAIRHFGVGFVFSTDWNPVRNRFGAAAFVYGTVVSSVLAIAIAFPISLGVALFLNELAPRRLASAVGFLVEMLAAIPSVVYGLWGLFVVAPWLRTVFEPMMIRYFGFIPLFQGPPYGVGMFTAGVVLAIMITPTISAISREIFRAVPLSHREAALALGATRWETIRLGVLNSSRLGILGAVILGLGRALGETMAVTMVIGNRKDIALSLFAPAQTMASLLANEYAEASDDLHLSALATVGFLLFLVSFLINSLARFLVWRVESRQKEGAPR
ncbi:MAG: phosphate ABC transporter permease subunit PstC [Oligoflexia bacterium]|nr:phosphate ABC transporter permease subunit PstC [Oligoflexia bacterium]